MKIKSMYIGIWFQRTTLHLSEVYDFLDDGRSPLDLNAGKLQDLHTALGIEEMSMNIDDLEYIQAKTNNNITVKIFEDGLSLFSLPVGDRKYVGNDTDILSNYYETKFSPALSYLFSLGAPIPKELANIKTTYPFFLVVEGATDEDVKALLKERGEKEYFEIKSESFDLYRGKRFYIINNRSEKDSSIEYMIGEYVFIKEFKAQMHRYLNLHRIIWERIAEVKEAGMMKGHDIRPFKNKIEGYEKAINLIDARINQMGIYVKTRALIIKNNPEFKHFAEILQFKHETLLDTLSYVKEIWKMTKNYVGSAIQLFGELQSKATNSSIKSLTIVTSMGVGATLIGLFTAKSAPEFTWFGVLYFFILAAVGWGANKLMKEISIRKKYKIKDTKADTNIE